MNFSRSFGGLLSTHSSRPPRGCWSPEYSRSRAAAFLPSHPTGPLKFLPFLSVPFQFPTPSPISFPPPLRFQSDPPSVLQKPGKKEAKSSPMKKQQLLGEIIVFIADSSPWLLAERGGSGQESSRVCFPCFCKLRDTPLCYCTSSSGRAARP